MVITKSEPYTKEEIEKLRETFDSYIKTVIDINKKVCSAGCDRHFESEQILLEQGSEQSDIWGGGIDMDSNPSNDILDPLKRKKYDELTKYYFKEIL